MAKNHGPKFWRANERIVMGKLGLKPVPGSGSGELYKEDGENDYVLCQLKSTEQQSTSLNRLDVEKLLYHAEVINKVPMFVIQFLNGPMLVATVPEELGNISEYLNNDLFERKQVEIFEPPKQTKRKKLKQSSGSFDEIVQRAREELEEQEIKDESFLSQAFSKRRERKNKK